MDYERRHKKNRLGGLGGTVTGKPGLVEAGVGRGRGRRGSN